MAINVGEVEAYGIMIERLQREAGRTARNRVKSWIKQHPRGTAAELRNASAIIVSEVVTDYGDSTASLACDLYDTCMTNEGFKLNPAEPWSGDSSDRIVRAVKYQLNKALDGDETAYLNAIDSMTQYYVRLAANNTTIQNVERDNGGRVLGGMSSNTENATHGNLDLPTRYYKETRRYTPRKNYSKSSRKAGDIAYARVPTGMETCSYCMMLASRGFVYRSADSAGHADHRGCNCMIVPGRYLQSEIDGIDTTEQYNCWLKLEELEAYAAKNPDKFDADELERRKHEIVNGFESITLSTDVAEVRKHASQGVTAWYVPRGRMADNYND